jgi:cell division protein FtsQ
MTLLMRALGSALLAVFATAAWFGGSWLLQPQTLPLRQVELIGPLRHAPRGELEERLAGYVGGSFLAVPVGRVREAVESHPWVARAMVSRRWPDTLRVRIEERRARARWGESALLDQNGEVFLADFADAAALPMLVGPVGSERSMLSTYRAAQQRFTGLGLAVEVLRQDARGARQLLLRNGLALKLGREDFEGRLSRFTAAFAAVLATRVEAIAGIDLRYANGFAVRWRPADAGQG